MGHTVRSIVEHPVYRGCGIQNISFHIITVGSQICTIFPTINQKYLTISWNFTQILTSSIAEASDRKHPKSPKNTQYSSNTHSKCPNHNFHPFSTTNKHPDNFFPAKNSPCDIFTIFKMTSLASSSLPTPLIQKRE